MKKILTAAILLCLVAISNAQLTTINGPIGSEKFGSNITVLTNGNYVITDSKWDNGSILNVGAVYLYSGATNSLISTLKGSTAEDNVGGGGIIALANGNFVVLSPSWENAAKNNIGAATWCNGLTGLNGVVSTANSITGSTTNDFIGQKGYSLPNGNFVITSGDWDNGAITDVGAVTWGNGATGTTGVVGSSNSLIGTTASTKLGCKQQCNRRWRNNTL
jgi:Repeat of unknown function (DUF5650)